MVLNNVRFGFATNSSSTHTTLIFKDPQLKSKIQTENEHNHGVFGWEDFTLNDIESKKRYALSTLIDNLSKKLDDDFLKYCIKGKYPDFDFINFDFHEMSEYCVDHQSLITLPKCLSNNRLQNSKVSIDWDFFDDYLNFVQRDDVIILGGNDNDDEHPLLLHCDKKLERFEPIEYIQECYSTIYSKKDGQWWILFDPKSGFKIRFSFEKDPIPYTKSTYPELVDIKITDYCDEGCKYCYQRSTKNGMHGDISIIRNAIRQLSEANVMEIAFGGGEPTKHPEFREILSMCDFWGIVPNFTTRSLEWVENEKMYETVKKCVGGIGFSVDNVEFLNKIVEISEKLNDDKINFCIQIVEGTMPDDVALEVMTICDNNGFSLLFLGFKEVGRGKAYDKKSGNLWKLYYDNVLSDYMKDGDTLNYLFRRNIRHGRVAIDTAFAKQHEKDLLECNVDPRSFYTEEGKYSMYLDLVKNKMGKSSYHETKPIPIEHLGGHRTNYGLDFDTVFQEYRCY